MGHTYKDDDQWKRDRNERAMREHFRKITDAAENRMLTRRAREQLLETMKENREPDDDGDDSSYQKERK